MSLTLLNNPVLAAGTESHYVSINSTSTSSGSNYNNDGASGANAIAIGQQATATAKNAVAIGYKAKAEGEGAFAFGEGAISKGIGTVAFGGGNEAYGSYSTAWGYNNVAGISVDGNETYIGATAFGTGTEARNQGATAMGNWSIAEGQNSVAMGNGSHTHSDAKASLAMGQDTHTLGTGSFAGGTDSIAGGFNSFAHGYTAEAVGSTAIAMGDDAKAIGDESVALGYNSKAFGDYSVAILGGRTGNGTFSYDEDFEMYDVDVTDNAIGAIAAGFGSVALKDYTVALGRHATVNNEKGIALGEDAVVSADNSIALGYGAVASEENVVSVGHKVGDVSYDGGTYSSALNRKIVNVAAGVDDTDAANVAQLKAGQTHYFDVNSTGTEAGSNYNNDGASGTNAIAVGYKAEASGEDSVAIGNGAKAEGKKAVVLGSNGARATGESAVAWGRGIASGVRATAWGGPLVTGGQEKYSTASGGDATAFGVGTTASGEHSTAWGVGSTASGNSATAWGNNTKATQNNATAWGSNTSAEYNGATAWGNSTVAKNHQATAFGSMTTASGWASTSWGLANGDGGRIIASNYASTAWGYSASRNIESNGVASTAFGYETQATGQMSTAFGQRTQATGAQATAFGAGSVASAKNATAFGATSIAGGVDATAFGTQSKAFGENSLAALGGMTGNGTVSQNPTTYVVTVSPTESAKGAVALGSNAHAKTDYAYAIGRGAVAEKENSFAIGYNSISSNSTSLALGNESAAAVDNVISVGHKETDVNRDGDAFGSELKRRIINVADGIDDSDAATVGQLKELSDDKANIDLDNITDDGKNVIKTNAKEAINVVGSDKAVVTKTDVSGVDTYTVSVTSDGAVASGDTDIVTGGTVYDALQAESRPATDGNYITTTNTAGTNLTALDAAVKANEDAIADLGNGKANVALDNITDDGKSVIKTNAKEAINVTGSGKATVTKTDVSGVDTYTVDVTANGQVVDGDTNIVTGGTVHTALLDETRPASDGNYIVQSGTAGANLSALDAAVKTNADVIDALDTNKANISLDNITDAGKTVIQNATNVVSGDDIINVTSATADGVKTYTVTANISADGQVDSGNTGLVSGGTVYNEVRPTSDGNYIAVVNTTGANLTALDTQVKANADAIATNTGDITDLKNLSNITDEGHDVIKTDAKSVINVTGDTDVLVTKTDVNGVNTYAISINKNGAVAQGNEEIVTGGTVYNALQGQRNEINDVLDTKANIDLDNITDNGKTVIKDLAKSSINVTGINKAVVTKTDENGVDTYTVDVKADGAVAQSDGNIVSGGTVYDALETAKSEISDALDTKANKDASNVSSNAENWGAAIGTGTVDAADGKLVTGSTVAGETRVASDGNYIAAANTAGQNITALDTQVKVNADAIEVLDTEKVNVSLDNITDDGKTVIQNATNVVSGDDSINVTSATADGVRTYTVSANFSTDGQVVSGNTGLVSGGTVFNEVRPVDGEYVSNSATTGANLNALDNAVKSNKDVIDRLSDGKANISLDNINDDGKDVIQKIARDSVKVQGRNHITSELVYDADGNAVYRVEDVVDGLVVENNKGIVDGGTVFNAIKDAKDEVTDTTDTKLQDYAKKDASNVSDAGAWGEKIATGSVAENEVRAVSGDTVYRALQNSEASTQRALDGKANVSLDNLNTDGKNVLQQSAITSVKVADGENTTVSSEYDADGNITYKVAANATGTVTDGDTNIVSGGTVYSALKNLSDNTDAQLDTKANKDLDNISDDGKSVVRILAQESVKVVDGDNTTVVEGTDGDAKTYAVHAITDGVIVSGNTGIVTGGMVYDAIQDSKMKYFGVNATSAYIPNIDGSGAIGSDSIAIGTSPMAMGDESVSIGTLSATMGEGAVAVGYMSTALSDGAVAVGPSSQAILENSTAIGNGAAAPYKNSVAIGAGSMATEENVFAVGAENKERRIVSVAAGTADTDAVNVSQLNTMSDGKADVDLGNITDDGKTVIKDNAKEAIMVVGQDLATVTKTDENGVDTYTVSVKADGVVDNSDEKVVSGQTVFAETRVSTDGNYIRQNNTSAQNMTALDTALKDVSDVANEAKDGLDGKSNVDMDNLSDTGKTEVRTLAKEAVKVINGTNTTVTEGTDGEAKTYAVDVVTNGRVESGDTGVVSGGTVYDALKTVTDDVADSLEGKADVNLRNIDTDGKTVVRNIARDAVQVQGDDHITSERVYDADGNSVYRLTAKTDGVVENNNTGLVSGGTVFDETRSSNGNYISKTNTAGENITALDDALKDVSDTVDETKEALDGKANTGLDNITPAGERVIKDLAKGSVTVKSGEYTNVVKSDETGVDTYTVNTVVNGAVASGNTGIVTGGTVYDAIQDVVSDTVDALDTKANVSLDNLNTDGNRYLQQKAIQSVKVVDGENTTVTSSYDADGNISYAVKAVADGEIAQGNGRLVTGGTVYDALKSQSDTMTEELNKKANADASNVTDAQAWGEKIATGQIASGDARAVSGDTVNALKTSVEEGLDNKANKSLDNITDNGKNVVRDLAKESISVVGDDDVVVTKQTAGNADEYSLSIRKNGTVASGDEALITGSTMFTELRPSDGNYVRNSYTTAGNLMTLDAKLKETYDIAVAAGQTGTDENAVHYDSADKSVVTMAGADGTKLTNLKDGEISQNSKDAVTGGQLYQVKQDVAANTQVIDTLSDKVGNTVDGTYVQSANSVGQNLNALDNQVKSNTDAISSLTESMNGKVDTDLSNLSDAGKDNVKNIAKESVEVVSSDNSVSVTKTDTDTLRTFDLSVNKDGKVEEGNNGIVTGGTVYNAIQDIQVVVDDVEEKLDGKMNKDMSNLTEEGKDVIKEAVKPELDKKANTDASNIDVNAWSDKLGVGEVAEGDNGLVKGNTVYQALQDVKDGAVSVEGDTIRIGGKAKYDNVDKVSVAKSDGSGRVITGVVTDVSDDTSAANVGYVKAVGETIIDGVNAGLHKMDNKINKVGAGAAALASIAPMPFDEDRKWTVAAAIGTYKGEQAGAIGAFYKPQENIMFNVRGVIGNGENMAGAGITIGLDKGPAKGLSKVAMAKVINTQAQEIQAQKAQLDAQKAELEAQKAEIQQLKEMVQKIANK